ncbi:MAG: SBBP repeat-containing protein [Chloroflexi bacterium]|nr:SBBP repeat-containing protein [Chloroflexota bacterium]
MKRFLLLIGLMIMIWGLTACNNQTTPVNNVPPPAANQGSNPGNTSQGVATPPAGTSQVGASMPVPAKPGFIQGTPPPERPSQSSGPTPTPNFAIMRSILTPAGAEDLKLAIPFDVAVDRNANMYVSDSGRILKFDVGGNLVKKFDIPKDAPLLFAGSLVVAPDQTIWIADTSANQVKHYDADGNVLPGLTSVGSDPGQLQQPTDVATDIQGNIYVAEKGNRRIQVFSPDGKSIRTFGKPGQEPGQITDPRSLAVDKDGNIYVVDVANVRVMKYDNQGNYVLEFEPPRSGDRFTLLRSVVYDSMRNLLFVLDGQGGRVHAYTTEGKYRRTYGDSGDGEFQFRNPQGLGVGLDGVVYVADTGNVRIQLINPSYP